MAHALSMEGAGEIVFETQTVEIHTAAIDVVDSDNNNNTNNTNNNNDEIDGILATSAEEEQPATVKGENDIAVTPWSFLVRCGINLVLPFINGMMMGFGEIFAHELCFRSGYRFVGTRVVAQDRRSSNGVAANKASVLVRN